MSVAGVEKAHHTPQIIMEKGTLGALVTLVLQVTRC